MTDMEFEDRALTILHNMSLEKKGWRGWFGRWFISHEPLRNDAANLLRDRGYEQRTPMNCRRVGDE